MTSVFCLLALNFIWNFCSVLAQIVIGLSPDSMFSLLIVATSSISFGLLHSLKCFLDLFFKPPACFSSQATVSWYHSLVLGLEPSKGVRNHFAFGRVLSLKRCVFHLFFSYFGSSRCFSRALASSFGKQLVFDHLPGWNQMFWPTLRAAQLVVCILHPCGPWLLSVPAISSPNSLPDKDCMTGKHWHTVHSKGIITNVQGVSETFPLCSLVSVLLPAYTW